MTTDYSNYEYRVGDCVLVNGHPIGHLNCCNRTGEFGTIEEIGEDRLHIKSIEPLNFEWWFYRDAITPLYPRNVFLEDDPTKPDFVPFMLGERVRITSPGIDLTGNIVSIGRENDDSDPQDRYSFDVSMDNPGSGCGENSSFRMFNSLQMKISRVGNGIRPSDHSETEDTESDNPCPSCGEDMSLDDFKLNCGECESCCGHSRCSECDAHTRRVTRNGQETVIECHDEVCDCCELCENHCSCYTCSRCSERTTDSSEYCEDCERLTTCCCECSRCDDCGRSSCDCDSGTIYAGRPFKATRPDHLTKFNCDRLVGVELEYNKAKKRKPLNDFFDQWRAGDHDDGSCGREVVTAPMAGNWLVDCLSDLDEVFKESEAEADNRCGIHVHVDTTDYSWHDMYRLLWVYSKVEPLLYLLAGQHRMTNHYCKPCGPHYARALSSVDRKGEVMAVAFGGGGDSDPGYDAKGSRKHQRGGPGKKDGGRYRGLNICPWLAARKLKASDNTVEFRIHRNSLDAGGRVLGWAKLCARLVEWCANASDREAQELPKSSIRALCKIAPDCKDWILARVKEWRKSCTPKKTSTTKPPRRLVFAGGTCYVRGGRIPPEHYLERAPLPSIAQQIITGVSSYLQEGF